MAPGGPSGQPKYLRALGSNTNIGRRSLQAIKDRVEGAQERKQEQLDSLSFFSGKKSEVNSKRLWVARFEAVRELQWKQDPDEPFSMDDIIGFLGEAITIVRRGSRQTPLKAALFLYAARLLIKYGEWKWRRGGFHITQGDQVNLQLWFHQMVGAGQLTSGFVYPKVWLGFSIVSQLVRIYLRYAIEMGTAQWDWTLNNTLAIVLISSLGCRAGDILLHPDYAGTNAYIKWEDIKMILGSNTDPEEALKDTRVSVILRYGKGRKGVPGRHTTKYLRPLCDKRYNHIDPVLLLLVQAFRTAQTSATNLNELLAQNSPYPGRPIEWIHPQRPVIFARTKRSLISLDSPKLSSSATQILKNMGKIAQFKSRLNSHGLRYGFARDINHIPAQHLSGRGLTSEITRQALDHTHASYRSGTTQLYAGDHTLHLHNLRAINPDYYDPERPVIAEVMDRTGSPTGIPAYVRMEPIEDLSDDEEEEDEEDEDDEDFEAGDEMNDDDGFKHGFDELMETIETLDQETQSDNESFEREDETECNDAGPSTVPGQTEVQQDDDTTGRKQRHRRSLGDMAREWAERSQTKPTLNQNTGLTTGFRNESDGIHSATPTGFVQFYSRINVVRCEEYLKAYRATLLHGTEPSKATAQRFPTSPSELHSKDPPTLHLHHCGKTEGCTYTTIACWAILLQHERICDERRVEHDSQIRMELASTPWICPEDGCGARYVEKGKLVRHIARKHVDEANFTPRTCDLGCRLHVYRSLEKWNLHLQNFHSDDPPRFPVICAVPGCTDKRKQFSVFDYVTHLETVHGITDEEELQEYVPPQQEKTRWIKKRDCPRLRRDGRKCPVDHFESPLAMTRHLTSIRHELSTTDAAAIVQHPGSYETVRLPAIVNSKEKQGVLPPLKLKKQWVKHQECHRRLKNGQKCTRVFFESQSAMHKHLIRPNHGLSPEDADAVIEQHGAFEYVQRPPKGTKKRKQDDMDEDMKSEELD